MARLLNLIAELVERAGKAEAMAAEDILEKIQEHLAERPMPSRGQPPGGGSRPPVVIGGVEWEDGAFRPKSIEEVQLIVKFARAHGLKVRVAGSQHSTPGAVFSANPGDLKVILCGELRHVDLNPTNEKGVVKVGGGCYLGVNPADKESTWANSLDAQLDAAGYALPVLGGISYQTIAGFLQTSSAGGSLCHTFGDAVRAIEVVDGTGEVKQFAKGSDEFGAAGVSLGLFGVITHVVLACEPRYFVEGTETNYEQDESLLAVQKGRYLLEDALRQTEYLHLDWYPQLKVKRVSQWAGARTTTGPPVKPWKSELQSKFKNVLAAVVLAIADGVDEIDPNGPVAEAIIGLLLRQFVPLGQRAEFRDSWYTVLPSDDQVEVDTLIKIIFTEIWLPMEQLKPAMDRLMDILKDQRVAGNFIVELYGAKQSPFWLSPSYAGDAFRVDVFWWAYNIGDPKHHFAYFWNVLLELPGAVLHWGKTLPLPGQQCGNIVFGPDFLQSRYSKLDAWRALRRIYDPDGVFVTDYWRQILGL